MNLTCLKSCVIQYQFSVLWERCSKVFAIFRSKICLWPKHHRVARWARYLCLGGKVRCSALKNRCYNFCWTSSDNWFQNQFLSPKPTFTAQAPTRLAEATAVHQKSRDTTTTSTCQIRYLAGHRKPALRMGSAPASEDGRWLKSAAECLTTDTTTGCV